MIKRVWKWVFRVAGMCGCVFLAVWLAQLFLLPPIVRHVAQSAFADLGFPQATFNIRGVSPFSTEISNIVATPGEPTRIGFVQITYTPLSLLRGQIHSILLRNSEVHWPLQIVQTSKTSQSNDLPFHELTIQSGTAVINSIRIPIDGTFTNRGAGLGQLEAQLRLEGVPVSIAGEINLRNGNGEAEIRLGPTDISTNRGQVQLRGVSGVFYLKGNAAAKELFMSKAESSWLAWKEIVAGDGSLVVDGNRITIGNLDASPAVAMKDGVTAGLRVRTEKAGVKWGKMGAPDVSFDLPVTWNRPGGESGKYSIAPLLPPLNNPPAMSGGVRLADGKLELDGSWPLLNEAAMKVRGWVDLMGGARNGQVSAKVEKFALKDEEALGTIFASMKGVGITGTFGMDGEVKFIEGKIEPRVRVEMEGARIVSKKYDVEIDGVSGAVTVNGFEPVTTPGGQQVRVGKARLGKFEAVDGGVTFRVESLNSILIEQTQWGWMGGRLFSDAFRINPASSDLSAVIYAEDLDVGKMLGLFTNGGASGQGTIYGRVPVRVSWPRVTFGTGFLYSAPGAGNVQMGKDVDTVGKMLDESDPRFANDPMYSQVKVRIMDALKDFQYDVLKVDFKQEKTGLMTTIHLQGKGRKGEKPQELNLNVNAPDLDWLLSKYLAVQRKYTIGG